MRRVVLGVCVLLVCAGVAAAAFVLNFLPAPLQVPYVVSIEPLNGATEIVPNAAVKIMFSTAMDRAATEKSVQFEPPVEGDFLWENDRTLTFMPATQFLVATTVTVNVLQGARSQFQRGLPAEVVTEFTTVTRPRVVESLPARDAQFVYVPDHVTIVFSRAMEPGMLGDTLVVEPQPQNYSFTVSGNTLTIYGFFEPQREYQITIHEMAVDAENGIALGSAYSVKFTVVSQYPNFSILNPDRVFKFSGDAAIQIPVQLANVSRLDVTLYPLSEQEFEAYADAAFETWYAFVPATAPLQTMTVFTNARIDRYTQQTIAVGRLAKGKYYLVVTSPEGVGDRQLVVVE